MVAIGASKQLTTPDTIGSLRFAAVQQGALASPQTMPSQSPQGAQSITGIFAATSSVRGGRGYNETAPVRAADGLVRRLLLARARWRWVTSVEAALLGLVAALVVTAFGLAIATLLHKTLGVGRLLAWTALVPALGTALAMLTHRFLSGRDLAQWAALRAVRHAEVDGELLKSGAELAHNLQSGTPPLTLGSPWLLVETLHQAEEQARGLDIDAAAIWVRCQRYGASLLLAALLAALAWRGVPDTWHDWWADPIAEQVPPRDIGTMVGDSRVRVDPPAYAAAVVPSRDDDGAETTVLRGSHVTVETSPLPGMVIEAVEVQTRLAGPPHSERQPVAELPGKGLVWQATLLDPVKYRYLGRDDQRQPVRETAWRELRVQADHPPRVALDKPSADLEVRPGQTVALQGQVDDDIGLLQVELVIQRPATGLERRPIEVRGNPAHHTVRESLAVDGLQLRPGESAELYLEAADTNPFDGARKGSSRKLRVRMFSSDRQHSKVLDALGQVADTWTLRLADRVERDPGDAHAELPEALKRRNQFAEEERKALDALHQLRMDLADDSLARPRSLADLDAIDKQLTDALTDEARSVPSGYSMAEGYTAVRQLYQLQRSHAMVVAAQEQAVVALVELAGDEREAALVRDSATLADTQRKLMSTLEKMADTNSKPMQAEAERLLDLVEQQVDRLATTAQKQARQVPHEHVNAQAIDPSGLPRDLADQRTGLAEVRRLLREGKSREALEKMRQLAENLAQASGGVQQGLAQHRGAEDRSYERLLQDLRRGIDRALDGQGRIRDDLRSPAEEQQHAQDDLMRQMRDTLAPQLGEMLNDIREMLRPSRLKTAVLRGGPALAEVRRALDGVGDALQRSSLDAAMQSLQEAQDELGAARRALAQGGENSKDTQADARRVDAAQERLSKMAERLREAMPEASELLRPASRQRVAGLGEPQAQVRNLLERLQKRLREAGDAHPALRQQVGERLDHALQVLREAEDSLRRGDAQRAFDQTAEILDTLERASEMLQQGGGSGQPRQEGSEQVGMEPGGSAEIRSGNQNDAVDRFREEVLKSMQQPEPGGWHDRLQRYYKAISR